MAEWSRAELANLNNALPKPEVALGEPVADLVAPTVGAGAVQCVPEPVVQGPSARRSRAGRPLPRPWGRHAPGLAVHPPGHSEGWHDISGFSYR